MPRKHHNEEVLEKVMRDMTKRRRGYRPIEAKGVRRGRPLREFGALDLSENY